MIKLHVVCLEIKMARQKKSIIRWVVIAAVLVAAVVIGWQFLPGKAQQPQYITVPVRVSDIEDTVLASGTFEAVQQVSVGAQVSGRVIALHVALNDRVNAGQLVAEIDSLTQQNNLKNAEAALTVAEAKLVAEQANLAQARLTYERQQRLRRSDASSQAEFEAAEASYKAIQANIGALQAQIDQAKIDVDTARVNLGYTQITSPMDGTVVAIVTKEGQTVNAMQSAPTIIKVANLDVMTVKAEISEADVTRVQPGQRVYFTILGEPDVRYEATLREIEPAPESISNESVSSTSSSSATAIYYNGLFDIENPDNKFRIDMTAEVNIVRDEAKDQLVLPSAALQTDTRKGGYFVRVLNAQGQPEIRPVTIGINNRVSVQIIDGVKEGENIIIGDSSQVTGSSTGGRPRGPMGF